MVTYGFYNSKDHDRRYDAIQMSSIFDGIVRDGIFMSIGGCLRVKQDSGMTILVETGRAWFNHTWTLNDAILPLEVPQSEIILNRIDAVVLEVNADVGVRANAIKIVKGTPATNPVAPTMIHTYTVNQYPLAHVYVGQRVSEIRQANITNMVGTSQTPFVTGILDTVNIDMLVAQWGDQWREFFEKQTEDMTSTNAFWKQQWQTWFAGQTTEMRNTFLSWVREWETFRTQYEEEMIDVGKGWKERWERWFYQYVNINSNDIAVWKDQNQSAFIAWWNSLKLLLDEDIATNLAASVVELQKKVEELERFRQDIIHDQSVYVNLTGDGIQIEPLLDENGETILDENMDTINGMHYIVDEITTSDLSPIQIRMKLNFNCKC